MEIVNMAANKNTIPGDVSAMTPGSSHLSLLTYMLTSSDCRY